MPNQLWRLLFTLVVLMVVFPGGETSQARPAEEQCSSIARELKLPAKLKTRGKPYRARWGKVDEVITNLRRKVEGTSCSLTLNQLFRPTKKELLFPLTNNLLRTTPDASLEGVEVFNQRGERLGQYANRVMYQRSGGLYSKSGYTLYYFQYKDSQGKLQSAGNQLLLDSYLVRWEDIKDKVFIAAESEAELATDSVN